MNPQISKQISKLTQMIKQAYVSLTSDDSSAYPVTQATYCDKATDVVRLSPYGLDSNPPSESFCLLLSSQAQEAVKFALISDMMNRKKNLKEGEVALNNTLTGSFVFLDADGNIVVSAPADISIAVDGQIQFAGSGESLKLILSDLIDKIKALTTFGSPASHSVTAASQDDLDAIKTRVETLLKE
jgi:phage gp45-like